MYCQFNILSSSENIQVVFHLQFNSVELSRSKLLSDENRTLTISTFTLSLSFNKLFRGAERITVNERMNPGDEGLPE